MKASRLAALLAALPTALAGQEQVTPGLTFVPGPADGALLERNGKVLAVYGDPSGRVPAADTVLLTHARRDVAWAARGLILAGAKAIVPAKEADLFAHPEKFWAEFREKRFHDYSQQSTKVPVEPIPVARAVAGGDTIDWEGVAFRVLDTPGYTRGAVSYVAELGGKKVAFTGDLIRDDGKIQDLFSLQDAIPEAVIGGYHGWAGRLGDHVKSLARIAAEKPDVIVPARGPVIRDPQESIARLLGRIRAAYANYLSIDALRWYFKDASTIARAARVDCRAEWMPMAETVPLPDWIVPISNSRLILAADGAGFLVDCGGTNIVDELKKMKAAGKLASVGHVFITHYHDDHTDALPVLVKEFGADVHACGSLVDVLEHPADYRLPCLTKNPIRVTEKHLDGASWMWKDFMLHIEHFPGQTIHHNCLLVRHRDGAAALFAGDSFTPTGIDDYCLQNRNILDGLGEPDTPGWRGKGYFSCLLTVGALPDGCLILNQHVEPAFRFSKEQIERMRSTLTARIPLMAALLPFDCPDFGLDEGWAVIHPYAVQVRPGDGVMVELRITNHSRREQTFRASVRAPEGLEAHAGCPVTIAAKGEGAITIGISAAAGTAPGLRVIAADVAWDGGELREWAEAMVEVKP